jgi:signal transduction histidine kinase
LRQEPLARANVNLDAVVRSLLLLASGIGAILPIWGTGPMVSQVPLLPVAFLLLLLLWDVSRTTTNKLDKRAGRARVAHDLLAWFLVMATVYLAYGVGGILPPGAAVAVVGVLIIVVIAAWVLDWPLLVPVWIGSSRVALSVFYLPAAAPFLGGLTSPAGSGRVAYLMPLAGLVISGVATYPLILFVRRVRREWHHRTESAGTFLSRLLLRIVAVGAVLAPIMFGFAVVTAGVAVSEYATYALAHSANPDWLPPAGGTSLVASWFRALLPGYVLSFTLVSATVLLALQWREGLLRQQVEVEERRRLQQDAHDRVYNRLSALSKRVRLASEGLTADASKRLEDIAEDIRTTVLDLQEILGDAPPRQIGHADGPAVVAQLERVCAAQASRLGIEVAFTSSDAMPSITPLVGWDLQCIVEEALTNASRHGRASKAVVALTVDEREVRLEVTDNGDGMAGTPDVDRLPTSAKGLRGMAERAANAGGALDISSGPLGTRITVTLPLASALSA